MSSFYGNGGSSNISKEIIDREVNNHIIFSKTQPTVQKAGDIWVVIGQFADRNNTENISTGENNNNNG